MTTRGDSWRTTILRWVKFNAVGGVGIGVQLAALVALRSLFHLDYMLATGLAVEAAVIHNFLWHERFTWADRRADQSFRRFMRFNLTTGMFSIAGNLGMMKLLVGIAHFNYFAANLMSIAACSIANFLVSDTFVFHEQVLVKPSTRSIPSGL